MLGVLICWPEAVACSELEFYVKDRRSGKTGSVFGTELFRGASLAPSLSVL